MANFQLFCFTFAGGTASFFDQIEQDLAEEQGKHNKQDLTGVGDKTVANAEKFDSIDVKKLEYAGHGDRFREASYKDFTSLADDMLDQFRKSYSSDSYALFGYSMGTVALIEVLRRILASIYPEPKHIFLGAHEPNTKRELLTLTSDELDTWIKERMLKFGTIPAELIDNKTFWRTYLPLYRADYKLLANYDFSDLALQTTIPATIFYSETDTPLKEMKLWEKYFKGRVDFVRYEGQHFFIQQHHEEMARVIADRLTSEAGR